MNFIAFRQNVKLKWISFFGAIACGLAIIANIIEKIDKIPYSIVGLLVISAGIFVFRPYLLKKMN